MWNPKKTLILHKCRNFVIFKAVSASVSVSWMDGGTEDMIPCKQNYNK